MGHTKQTAQAAVVRFMFFIHKVKSSLLLGVVTTAVL